LPFDILPFDILPFDILPFDILPFDILPFDILPFDILSLDPRLPERAEDEKNKMRLDVLLAPGPGVFCALA
jgi:hypothetical protein